MDFEAQKRIDSEMIESAQFRIREMEEEMRKEVERDAGLLKAKNKLVQQGGASTSDE